ncbi:hypothetical protein ACP275_05G046900 [Erythranthe tilingii]
MTATRAAAFLLMLLVITEIGEAVNSNVEDDQSSNWCLQRSHKFLGLCRENSVCARVCRNEGYHHGGDCQGTKFTCYCYTPCHSAYI